MGAEGEGRGQRWKMLEENIFTFPAFSCDMVESYPQTSRAYCYPRERR